MAESLTKVAVGGLAVWAGVAGMFWLVRLVALEIGRRSQPRLSPRDPPVSLPIPPPRVSVLVAGKDEQAGIETCVRSLQEQDYPDYEIILIDDRSTDATPAIVDRLAAEQPGRIRALHVQHLPEGWAGKNNAMRTGIAAATGEWLLMVDADCRQLSGRSISLAVARALQTRADMLSVMAAMEPQHFWDRAVQPILAGMLLVWFPPNRVNDPASSVGYANGAFMMIRRGAYHQIGGHDAVKAELNEDIQLARLVKAAGMRLHVTLNDGLYLTRMYETLPQMVRGWSRIFYGSLKAVGPLAVSLILLTTLSSAPVWLGLTTLLLGPTLGWAGPVGAWLAPSVLAALAAQTAALMRFYRLAGVGPLYALFYPLAAVVQAIVLLNAIARVRQGGGVVWRGTHYPPGSAKASA